MLTVLLACATPDPEAHIPDRGASSTLTGTEDPELAVDSGSADTATTVEDDDDDEGADEDPADEPTPDAPTWVCDEEIRNGSEICDDAAFGVPDPYEPRALVCVTGEGGVGYVASNTGPTMSDGIARCQGWEENGQDAWDHLQYVEQLTCGYDGQVLEVDLEAWRGQTMWVGVHDHPLGGGHMTHVCIAHQE